VFRKPAVWFEKPSSLPQNSIFLKAETRPFLLILFLWFALLSAQAQFLGGQNSFAFLRQPANAPLAAMGGVNVSQSDFDVNRWLSNPALLNADMGKHASLNYVPFYAQIRHLSAVYADEFKLGRMGGALQYVDYGTFDETDAAGNVLGTFRVSEYAVSAAHARTQGAYTMGVALKLIGSNIANYSSYAAALDLGGFWKHPEHDWTIGLAIRNAGLVLKKYDPAANQGGLPLDVQLGTSFKPKFMPFRFSITAHHLHQPDISYDDPLLNVGVDANGNPVARRVSFADKVARHFTFGTELVLAKAFHIRLGYNHLIRQEMRLQNGAFGAGFSFGFLLKTKQLQLGYARFYQQAAGGVSYLTLTGNLGAVIKRKN
jgi:hypothetical protein